MAALDIPGYYYDETKKRYFKIMPTGKYSLASINQAKKEREKEIKQQQEKEEEKKRRKKNKLDASTSIYLFQQQRSIHSLISRSILQKKGIHSFYHHLIQQSQFTLDTIEQDYSMYCTNMILEDRFNDIDNDHHQHHHNNNNTMMKNGFIMADKNGYIKRYGFQCDPQLKIWKTSHTFQIYPNITSLHYVPYHYRHSILQKDGVLGTSLGSDGNHPNLLWYLKLPYNNENENENENQQPEILYEFSRTQGSFWSSCIGKTLNDQWMEILLGGDKHVFKLNIECELSFQMKCKSAVLATSFHQKEGDTNLFWLGCRNGDIQLIDDRCCYKDTFHHYFPSLQFHQSSSITHLKPLHHFSSSTSTFQLLSASMDGSINLWDLRYIQSIPSSNPSSSYHYKRKKKNNSIPLQTFRGHQNEYSRQLAFHLDPKTNLFTMAGNDQKIRIWSLSDNHPIVDPIWTSPTFHDCTIPYASILSLSSSSSLSIYMNDNQVDSNPGMFICSQHQNNSPDLHWYSIPS